MEGNENYGLILKILRQKSGLSVREHSKRINKSPGWLSEVENGRGLAKLSESEFERIIALLGATGHRAYFKTWVANHRNAERVDRSMEGAILKFVRVKKGLRLEVVAANAAVSACYLSRVENGHKPPPLELRNRILIACGYSPTSFKNLSSDPIKSRAVPYSYKLNILLKKLPEEKIAEVFGFAQSLIQGGVWSAGIKLDSISS